MIGLNRRTFLMLAGASMAGLGARSVLESLASEGRSKQQRSPEALVGRRWAMVVDPKRCWESKDGCRDCIDACHRGHNVPDIPDPMHEIKWIWRDPYEHAFPAQKHRYIENAFRGSPIVLMCNHCDNPPCVRVCPTKATWKREDGIVMMDQHRCIGCRFCMAACPYGSRSFNWIDPRPYIRKRNPDYPTRTKGVVEKCNFCAERLAVGRIPLCVEACKTKGLVFGDLADEGSALRRFLSSHYSIRRKPELGTMPEIYYIV